VNQEAAKLLLNDYQAACESLQEKLMAAENTVHELRAKVLDAQSKFNAAEVMYCAIFGVEMPGAGVEPARVRRNLRDEVAAVLADGAFHPIAYITGRVGLVRAGQVLKALERLAEKGKAQHYFDNGEDRGWGLPISLTKPAISLTTPAGETSTDGHDA
jgi:hypothetical protein